MKFTSMLAAAAILALASGPGFAAGEADSVYTKIDFDNGCVPLMQDELGGSFSCVGHGGYGILFSEGDLRQSLFFGYVGDWYAGAVWESFGAFNQTNDTVEWRLRDGVPYATILRWLIENVNPDTGIPDEAHRGQVLVVSKVGQPGIGDACVVGYVDARENGNANELARSVADNFAENFICRVNTPEFHGDRGTLTSEPSRTFEP